MLSLERLREQSNTREWLRSLGYVRNGRVNGLAVDATDPHQIVITAKVRAARTYPVRLSWRDWSADPAAEQTLAGSVGQDLDASCSCPVKDTLLCRHATAVGIQFLRQIGDAPSEAALSGLATWAEASFGPLEIGDATEPVKTQIEILIQYSKPDDLIRILPRMILLDPEGRKLARILPLDQQGYQSLFAEQEKPEMRDEIGEIHQFFAQWPGLKLDLSGSFTLNGDTGIYRLFHDMVPQMPADWIVRYDEELEKRRPLRQPLITTIQKPEIRQPGLLSFSVSFHCGQMQITLDQLRQYAADQQQWLIENSRFVEIENRTQIVQLLNLLEFENSDRNSRQDATDSSLGGGAITDGDQCWIQSARITELKDWIDAVLSAQHVGSKRIDETPGKPAVILDTQSRQLMQGLRSDEKPDALAGDDLWSQPRLAKLEKCLLPFQKDGVRWLLFLRQWQFGGILADDMGLGKTVQVLAFLLACPKKRTSLIICPKSLLFNWLHEAKRFTPDLRVMLVQGNRSNRHYILRQAGDCDLLITSYPLFQSDLDWYQDQVFDSMILDEAQMIKNPDTRLARQVKLIKADQRLALSGTPLENARMDLWSLFDFVMPGLLAQRGAFKTKYIEAQASAKDFRTGETPDQNLVRRIKPFILRRTKADVLHDLPPKIEEPLYVRMTQNQLALYDHTLRQIKKDMSQNQNANKGSQPQMAILAGLTRLRQICNHPGLLFPQYKNSSGQSGKMDLLDLLLEQSIANQHKILIFSQFTQMLSILASRLTAKNIGFVRLDGQTNDRQAVVNQFNTDRQISVFLISLKAGGFGLNLTVADTAILYDPWWNPMVEDQAADRIYRFGQTKSVTIYRLITEGTIEEKMEHLKQRKRSLFNAIVNEAGVKDDGWSLDDLRLLLEDED